MTATEFLAITRPEDLFPGDINAARDIYRKLSKAWHPDVKGGSAEVFAHISSLYREALAKLNGACWEGTAEISLKDVAGVVHVVHTRSSSKFALGQALLADHEVIYLVDPLHAKLFHDGYTAINNAFRYKSDEMRKEFERYLPKDPAILRLEDGRLGLRIAKTPDLICLRDVITHLGPMDPKHVAWITSSLLNLACYLTYTQVVNQDISPDTYFISPEFHSGALLGGWWFAAPRGKDARIIPKRTFELMPFKAKLEKRASTLTDLECIRATARECLGGLKAPEPMNTWLNSVKTESAYHQYAEWVEILGKTFGKRRFVAMTVDAEKVYGSHTPAS